MRTKPRRKPAGQKRARDVAAPRGWVVIHATGDGRTVETRIRTYDRLKAYTARLERRGVSFVVLSAAATSHDVTAAQRRVIERKIPKLRHEGYPEKQAIAIAYREAGVPPRRARRRHARAR